jgi:small conductance mechanosensitive channel
MSESVEKIVGTILELGTVYGLRLAGAIVIFFVGKWVAKLLRQVVERMMTRSKVDATLVKFTGNLVYAILMVVVVLAALNQIGVQTTSLIAVIGAAGLAVAFALQGSLANFAAGVMLIIFRPFKVGDFIQGGGEAGIVEEIGLFTTQMRTPDNKTIIVPNSNVTGGNITNFSAKDTRRVDLTIGVSYSDDLKKVKAVLADILAQDERILKDPEATIGVVALGESSIDFAVRPWVNAGDYWDVYFHTLQTIKERFDAESISIPFPQRDIHIYRDPASLSASA